MIVKVQNKENTSLEVIYNDVSKIRERFADNGIICNQLVMENGETATFPMMEWRVFRQGWIEM